MPTDEMVEKVKNAIRDAVGCHTATGRPGVGCMTMDVPELCSCWVAAKAALSAAHAEPVARDPSRFSRLSPDEPPVIRERPDPTLGFISTAEMLASPSEAAIRADDVRLGPIAHRICDMLEAAGEPRPNGDIMHDVLTRVLATAIRARGET